MPAARAARRRPPTGTRLARAGRYGFLRRPVVEIAVRRFDEEGFWKQSLKWLGIELHRLTLGEIRGDYFRYFK